MIRRLALAVGFLLGLTGLAMQGTQTASAVTIGPHTPVPGAVSIYDSLVQPVQYGRCREVRRDCANLECHGTPHLIQVTGEFLLASISNSGVEVNRRR